MREAEIMIAIGNGEECPFCKDNKHTKVFVMEEGKDFLKHLTVKHPKQLEEFLFGGNSIGL